MIKSLVRSLLKVIPQNKPIYTLLKKAGIPNKVSQYLDFKGEYEVKLGNKSIKLINKGEWVDNRLFWRGLEQGEATSIKIEQELFCMSKTYYSGY
ncbi:MAG: hypothetical protein M3Q97_03855 [Bacteroidota bacterium]|nr:hypothetical protein [Bacteroidota bacterium]